MSYKKHRSLVLILSVLTLLIATFLHLWRLPELPAAISGDEADNGLEALLLMAEPKLIVFAPSNIGREALFHYLLMVPFGIFGPTVFALRIWPAIAGILIVALSYRWVKALLHPSSHSIWVAQLTAVFVATSLWVLHLSRIGLRGILLVPCMLAAYYFFWNGCQRRKYRWFVLSGFFLGLATHTYTASRLLPLTFILFVVYLSLFHYKREAVRLWFIWRGLFVTGLVSIAVFAPLGWYFFKHPGALVFRSSQVSLWANYQAFHAHTGQSFIQFLLATWGQNLRWFISVSTPWLQNEELPSILHLIPLFFWIGFFRTIYLARRHGGYTFLLISFFVGLLPIILGLATTMRVIMAIPATYALLAIGAYYPIEYLLSRVKSWDLPINVAAVVGVLLISTVSSVGLFRFEQWIGLPPLPTLFDHAFDVAANRIRALVLEERRSVLVPQVVYGFPPAKFTLIKDFSAPVPVKDTAVLAPTETISVFWPVEWARWFNNKPPSFVLLSPGVEGGIGHIEAVGQWEQTKIVDFKAVVQAQQTLPQTEVVIDGTGRPIGYLIEMNRDQVIESLRTVPHKPVQFNFQDEISLLGYDIWFLSEQNLDIGLFWQAQQNILEDHDFLLRVVDRHGQVLGETAGTFDEPTASWYPEQLIIDHQIIRLTGELQPGVYVLQLGLIKFNYKKRLASAWGEWVSATNLAGVLLPELIVPIGLIQAGEAPHFEHNLLVNFADKISLTGYRLDQGATPDMFRISLRWQALQPIDKDYTVTIQMLDENQMLVAQVDGPPLGGAYPTTVWQPGLEVLDTYDLSLPEAVPSGAYQLSVGVYESQTLQRLPLSQADDAVPGTELAIMQQIIVN